jgi:ribose transport system permease protein
MIPRTETSTRRTPVSRRVRTSMPYALLAIMCVALFVFPQFASPQTSTFNIYDALQLWSAYGLVALGVGLTMIVGEFDFSVLGVFALCPMIAVKLGEYNLFLGLGAALALAAFVGLLEGAIVAKLRVHSMPVTLGFYIALLGANLAIGNSQSVSFSNLDVGSALDAAKFYILSWRSIIALIVFALVFVVMRFPEVGRDIRAVGGDRRASRMVGVAVDRVLIGVFITSAVCSALGGILLAYSFATALSNPGLYPLQFAVTAAIVGGVSLVGGVGGGSRHRRRSVDAEPAPGAFLALGGADLPLEPHHRRIARAGDLRCRAGLMRAVEIVRVTACARRRRRPGGLPTGSEMIEGQ